MYHFTSFGLFLLMHFLFFVLFAVEEDEEPVSIIYSYLQIC